MAFGALFRQTHYKSLNIFELECLRTLGFVLVYCINHFFKLCQLLSMLCLPIKRGRFQGFRLASTLCCLQLCFIQGATQNALSLWMSARPFTLNLGLTLTNRTPSAGAALFCLFPIARRFAFWGTRDLIQNTVGPNWMPPYNVELVLIFPGWMDLSEVEVTIDKLL